MVYDENKIKKFHEYTVKDYSASLVVENVADVDLVEKTDKTFTQIGIRPIIEEGIFIDPGFHEHLPGAGRMIAIGEEEFLIKNLLENGAIKKIDLSEDIEEFPKYLNFEQNVILISTKFYVDIFTKLMHRIDYEEKYPRLDKRYRIISIPERILSNKIILIGKGAILWKKQLFDDKETGKKEKLDIIINPAKQFGKVDIIIRSVNKMIISDIEQIKILEVEDNGKKS
jgi:hypothetical protein